LISISSTMAGRLLSCGGSHAFLVARRTNDLEPDIDVIRHLARMCADIVRIEAGEMTDCREAALVGEEKLTGLMCQQ
jgi:hypothetical protein